ncbi:MAG: DUF2568 domain-containing protein [Leucobacter sp.]
MTNELRPSETGPSKNHRASAALQVVRMLFHLGVVISATLWGFTDWAFPFPALLAGAASLALTIVIWALFLSPRPVLHTDRFGHALIEVLFLATGAGALLAMGVQWWIAAAFFVVGAILGYIATPRSK